MSSCGGQYRRNCMNKEEIISLIEDWRSEANLCEIGETQETLFNCANDLERLLESE